jgi:fructoselysine-6-P-deglycase FrlB-like protein
MATDMSWYTDEYPELRDGPPWVMEDMIEAQQPLPAAIVGNPVAEAATVAQAIDAAAAADEPIVVVGCGTSEHGAMAVAAILAERWPDARVESRQALDAAIKPRVGGVCIGISHDGGTNATRLALDAAHATGATTAAITAMPGGAVAGASDHVIVTPVHDVSWCHTLAYASAILAAAAITEAASADRLTAALDQALAARPALAQAASKLLPGRRVITTGLGVDHVTARELALKIEEGARIPSNAHQLETLLHGHLAGCDADTTAVVRFAMDSSGGELHSQRERDVDAALAEIGIPTVVIGTELGLSEPESAAEALLASAVALQLLTLELAHLAGTNPDLIRREQAAYRKAAEVSGG